MKHLKFAKCGCLAGAQIMRRLLPMTFLGAAAALAAAEITWKGGGDTSAWSDGTNWEGGVAPSEGDTVVIPDGKIAYMSSSDITWVASQGLALISLPGGDFTFQRCAVHLMVAEPQHERNCAELHCSR